MNLAGQVQFATAPRTWLVSGRELPLIVRRNHRARRYIVRLDREGRIVLTIPRTGTLRDGMDFIGRTGPWLERRLASHMRAPDRAWREGSEILLAGRGERIEATPLGARLGPLFVAGSFQPGEDLRPYFEPQLRRLAEKELPLRTQTLADAHGLRISRVSVRNQKSRWGSCSSRGVISLNWQLIRTPDYVRDYIILHELMHLRQMNHSARFWREVESVCPDWRRAEAWLKGPGRELLR